MWFAEQRNTSRELAELEVLDVTEAQVKAIEAVLAKGDRVELIPTKDGVHVVRVRRDTVKT